MRSDGGPEKTCTNPGDGQFPLPQERKTAAVQSEKFNRSHRDRRIAFALPPFRQRLIADTHRLAAMVLGVASISTFDQICERKAFSIFSLEANEGVRAPIMIFSMVDRESPVTSANLGAVLPQSIMAMRRFRIAVEAGSFTRVQNTQIYVHPSMLFPFPCFQMKWGNAENVSPGT
jgi:hypothetical protein